MPKRPQHHRKSAKKAAAKKTAKKRRFYQPEEPPPPSYDDYAAEPHSCLSTFLFWPFFLINAMTRRWPGFLKFPLRLCAYGGILAVIALIVGAIYYGMRSTSFDMKEVAEMPERSVVLDRTGTVLGKLHGENRNVVPLSAVTQDFTYALLAREDVRFFDHGAVDFKGLLRATFQNIKRGRMAQGGSTLTMQLARNSFILHNGKEGPIAELDRKFLEIAVAYRIENNYSKEEVLEHYINRIFWGHNIQGIEAAAQTYLEKPAKKLTLSDSAMLAGIIRGPNAFSPFRHLDLAIRERDTVLERMVHYEFITQQQADTAIREVPKIGKREPQARKNIYAMKAIDRELKKILGESNINAGGLTIKTTIDQRIQESAEQALDRHLTSLENRSGYRHRTRNQWRQRFGNLPSHERPAPDYLQGGLVLVENKTGAVIATVGGRNASESSFDRARNAKRQVGSIFKPFVFMTAHDRDRSKRLKPRAHDQPIILPRTFISDEPMQPGEIAGASLDWIPKNSDGQYFPLVQAQDSLIQSRNTSSIRVGSYAGLENVIKTADLAGFNSEKIPKLPASYLGTWEATPWQVASAYSIFPNLGKRIPPHVISEIIDRHGEVVYRAPQFGNRAASSGATWATSHVLQLVVRDGTAKSLHTRYGVRFPNGGKTGTTNNYVDGWYAGYTSGLTCAVWVGMDTPKRVMDQGYGSTLALPIWAEVMKSAVSTGSYPTEDLTPSNLSFVKCRLCQYSAQRANQKCENLGCAYDAVLPKDLVPIKNDYCTMHPDSATRRAIIPPTLNKTPPRPSQRIPQATPYTPPPGPSRVQQRPIQPAPQRTPPPVQRPSPPQALPVNPSEIPQALPITPRHSETPPQALPVN